jgi:oligopeptide transport system ATP-binding protein
MPRLDEQRIAELTAIPGQPPNLQALPAGCAFRDRCRYAFGRCRVRPELLELDQTRSKACHLEQLA